MFEDNSIHQPQTITTEPAIPILEAEVKHAVKQVKTTKALAPYKIPTEFFKLFDEHNLKTLTNIFNHK